MRNNQNLFKMIKFFFQCKKAAYFTIFMIMLGLVVGIATPLFNELIVNEVIPDSQFSMFIYITIVVLILNLVSVLSSFFTTRTLVINCVSISSKIREDLIEMNVYSNKHHKDKGKVLLTSTIFMEDVNIYYISYMQLIFDSILKVCFYVPMFIFYGRYLSFIMMTFALISFLFVSIANKMAIKHMKRSRLAEAEASDYVLELLKKLEKEDFKEDETYNADVYMNKIEAKDQSWLGYCNWANTYTYIFNFVWYIGVAICFCLAHNMITGGVIGIGVFVAFNSYLDQVKAPICNYLNYKLMGVRFNETFQKIFDLLKEDLKEYKICNQK